MLIRIAQNCIISNNSNKTSFDPAHKSSDANYSCYKLAYSAAKAGLNIEFQSKIIQNFNPYLNPVLQSGSPELQSFYSSPWPMKFSLMYSSTCKHLCCHLIINNLSSVLIVYYLTARINALFPTAL